MHEERLATVAAVIQWFVDLIDALAPHRHILDPKTHEVMFCARVGTPRFRYFIDFEFPICPACGRRVTLPTP